MISSDSQLNLRPKGFTLVELVTSFAILIVITVGVVVSFRRLSPTQALENASDILRTTFIDMRTAAIAAQQCCGGVTPDGYGISIVLDGSPDHTINYFADFDGDSLYTSADTLLRTTILSDNIDMAACEMKAVITTSGVCTVVLTTGSSSDMYYNGGLASDTITLTITTSTAKENYLYIYPAVSVIE